MLSCPPVSTICHSHVYPFLNIVFPAFLLSSPSSYSFSRNCVFARPFVGYSVVSGWLMGGHCWTLWLPAYCFGCHKWILLSGQGWFFFNMCLLLVITFMIGSDIYIGGICFLSQILCLECLHSVFFIFNFVFVAFTSSQQVLV